MSTLVVPVVSANICCNPKRRQIFVRARVIRALTLFVAGFVAFQEINIPRYSRAVRRQSAKRGRRVMGLGHECPVSLPLAWLVQSSTIHRVHGGLARVSPSRIITELLCLLQEDWKVAFLACHPVSKPRKGVDHAAWRMTHWKLYIRFLQARIVTLHALGYTVFIAGDMNRTELLQLHPAEVHVLDHGLDHLRVVPAAGVTVRSISSRHVVPRTRFMDHPIIGARVELERAA